MSHGHLALREAAVSSPLLLLSKEVVTSDLIIEILVPDPYSKRATMFSNCLIGQLVLSLSPYLPS